LKITLKILYLTTDSYYASKYLLLTANYAYGEHCTIGNRAFSNTT